MSLPPYLTDEEIAHITHPRKQGAARIRYFREVVKVAVEARPNGQPLVWRRDFEAAKLTVGAANDPSASEPPDWTAFDQKVSYGRGAEKKRRQSAGT